MVEVIEVKLREAGKIFYYNPRGLKFKTQELVVVEADRGIDYGRVISDVRKVDEKKIEGPLKAVIRKVDKNDAQKIEDIKNKAKEAQDTCIKKINEHNLPMKLVCGEYSFDMSKLIFYFTSEGRVDFRRLVKDLASVFKVRIELRQIGVRDEAKLMNGYGHCGRPLCCGAFLREFDPVTIKMAKEQKLSLNPNKISGVCGRLMCCLGYEFKTYKELSKFLPREGGKIKVKNEVGRVMKVDLLRRKVKVEMESGAVRDLSFEDCTCPKPGCPAHEGISQIKSGGKPKKNKKDNKADDYKKEEPSGGNDKKSSNIRDRSAKSGKPGRNNNRNRGRRNYKGKNNGKQQ